MISRRAFLVRATTGAAAASLGGRVLRAQAAAGATQSTQAPGRPMSGMDSSNLFPMDQLASRPVRLPPKANARPSMSAAARDDLEHRIKCQCGCTLDVYTCRTTDFSCQVSPAMHRDVMALVEGGYSAQEIVDAFTKVYGEQVLMSPTKEGFNLFGYVAPFAALGVGAIVVFAIIRRWGAARRRTVASSGSAPTGVDATPDEMARLEAAVRDDE